MLMPVVHTGAGEVLPKSNEDSILDHCHLPFPQDKALPMTYLPKPVRLSVISYLVELERGISFSPLFMDQGGAKEQVRVFFLQEGEGQEKALLLRLCLGGV